MPRILNAFDLYKKIIAKIGHQPGGKIVALLLAIAYWRAQHVAAGNEEYADELVEDDTPVQAFINHGRWMILCSCRNGVIIPPPDEPGHKAVCPSCGTVWTTILFPEEGELQGIVAALEERRLRVTQSWFPGESVGQLLAENEANPRGLHPRKGQ